MGRIEALKAEFAHSEFGGTISYAIDEAARIAVEEYKEKLTGKMKQLANKIKDEY